MNKKYLMFGIPLLTIGLVFAALTYYGMFSVALDVNQPITITGNLEQSVLGCDAGETCIGKMVRVNNSADEPRTVTIKKIYGNDNIVVSYVGILELTKKDSDWNPIAGDKIELTYTVLGETFEFSEVLDGHTLIYYKDFVVGLDDRIANPQPVIIVTSDIGSLPQNDDVNKELEDYCQDPDNYAHCNGAKLWIVPNGDMTDTNTLSWANMFDGYYYETDLIYYFNNSEGELTIPANSFIEFYPAFTPDKYIEGKEYNFGFEIQ